MTREEQLELLNKVQKDLEEEFFKNGGRGVSMAEALDHLNAAIENLSDC